MRRRSYPASARALTLSLGLIGLGASSALAQSAPRQTSAQQLAWVLAPSSAAIAEPSSLDLAAQRLQTTPKRKLAAGQWTMLRLAPLGRVRLEAVGLDAAKIQARELLGQDAQAFVEASLHKTQSGVLELRNPSVNARVFLLGGATEDLALELYAQATVRPDLAWDRASAELLADSSREERGQGWLRSNPRIQTLLAGKETLSKAYPEYQDAVDAWAHWALAKRLLSLRPSSITGWSKKTLKVQGASLGEWTRKDLQGREKRYARVSGPQTLWVEAQGPGVLDLELRAVVGAAQQAPVVTVHLHGELAESLRAPLKEANFACEEGSVQRRCPVSVGDQGLLGQAARTRIALLKGERTRVRIDVEGGAGLLALRQDRLRPRLGKDPLRRASLDACKSLSAKLSASSEASEPMAALTALSRGCVVASASDAKAQVKTLRSLCEGASDPARSLFAKALLDLGAQDAAHACGGRARTGERPNPSATLAKLAELYPRLSSNSEAAWSSSLRNRFLQGYREESRWIRLSPEPGQGTAQSWIADAEPPQAPSVEQWLPGRSWSAIEAGQTYRIDAPIQDAAEPHLSRLDLAWEMQNPPARILIDEQPQELDPRRSGGSWLLAPGPHRIQLDAKASAKLFATIEPGKSTRPASSRVIKLWPLGAKAEPLAFVLPKGAGVLPLRVSLRFAGSKPYVKAQSLWLRDDQGGKTRIELTGKSVEQEEALALSGQGPVSTALVFDTKVSPQATRVWVERDGDAQEEILVAIRYRGSKRGQPSEATALAQKEGAVNAFVSNPDIAYGQRLKTQKQWGSLRKLLVQWSDQPAPELKKHRAERLALFDAYRDYLSENAGAYKVVKQGHLPAVLPAFFLGEQETLDLKQASSKLQTRVKELQAPSAKADAIWAAYRFSASAQGEDASSSKFWPLAYGLMHLPGYQISNPRLNALRARSAKHTRWSSLDFAYQSAGFEHIERAGLSSAQQDESFDSALKQDPGAFGLSPSQTRTLRIEAAQQQELRLSSDCRSELGQSELPRISVSLDDAQAEVFEQGSGKVQELQWSLPAGAHTLSVQSSPASRCVLRARTKQEGQDDWSTVSMPSKQRWFATGPKRALSFHAQGPGVLALQTRPLGDTSGRTQLLVKRSSESSSTQLSFGLVSMKDPEYALSRDPKLTVHAAEQNFVILPEDEVYLVELNSPEREVLVRAKLRVPDPSTQVQLVKQDWAKTLASQLQSEARAKGPSMALPVPQLGTRQTFKPEASDLGSFDLSMRSGIERDTQFETIQSRVVSGLWGSYRRELSPGRLWFQGQLSAQSQRFAAPMFAATLQLSAQAKRMPIRARVWGQFGAQPVLGQVPMAGRAWLDVEASLRNAYTKSTSWDLRPSLRLDTRMIGEVAKRLGPDDSEQLLSSSIYRRYAVDHAVALKPKLVWTYRDLRNARIDVGSDLWLNADFKGLDRTRAWLRFAGIYRRSSARPSWWIYQGGYRFTYALVDTHRRNAYMRHALQGQVRFAWQWAERRRLYLSLADTILFSDQGFAGNEIRLNLGLRFDPLEAFRHSAPHERRFLGEFGRQDWKVVGLR